MTENEIKEKANELIKYAVLSEILTGSKTTIRKEKIPEKYKFAIEQLQNKIADWVNIASQAYTRNDPQEKFKELSK